MKTNSSTKKVTIAYWIFTGIFTVLMIMAIVPSLIGAQLIVDIITTHYGYPSYFVFYTGLVKLLGMIAILVPGFPRLKEWAYAGLAFDLISVIYSGIAVGDSVTDWGMMIPYLLILAGSYVCFRKRTNARPAPAPAAPASERVEDRQPTLA
jgi:hypothetical protein